jgi:tRNA pseudouridine32 synthase/23S rRNA pseudouridine746 synthase
MFSVNKKTRGLYHALFMHGKATKTYHAIAVVDQHPQVDRWVVQSRLVRGEPRFRMKTTAGAVNSESHIHLLKVHENRGNFRLNPVTGKTHQLRVHMSSLGFSIVNDRLYPELLPEQNDNFDKPLQLLAKEIEFQDPITGKTLEFHSEQVLVF